MGESISGRWNSKCKGPEAEVFNMLEAKMTGSEGDSGR
jgi:hypothetical protein